MQCDCVESAEEIELNNRAYNQRSKLQVSTMIIVIICYAYRGKTHKFEVGEFWIDRRLLYYSCNDADVVVKKNHIIFDSFLLLSRFKFQNFYVYSMFSSFHLMIKCSSGCDVFFGFASFTLENWYVCIQPIMYINARAAKAFVSVRSHVCRLYWTGKLIDRERNSSILLFVHSIYSFASSKML